MSEIAIISARKTTLANREKQGDKGAKTALKLANNPDKFLSTVQIGITLIGILTGIYSGATLSDKVAILLNTIGLAQNISHLIAQAIIVLTVTYLSIVVGELVPKRIGMSIAEKVSVKVARPMLLLSKLAAPFVWLLSKSTEGLVNMLGLRNARSKVTEADIKLIVQEGKEDGEVQEMEQDIVERVFMLGDLHISQLMTHRSDITMLDNTLNSADVREAIAKSTHVAYPVVNTDNDKITGVAYLKDIALTLNNPEFNLTNIAKPAVFFYENMTVYSALEQMKLKKISQAFICDEFGEFQGIITLRDILEGLVGTLEEQNNEPNIVKRKDENSWLVDGQCMLHEFLTYFEREDLFETSRRYNTVAGMIIDTMKHIPLTGENVAWQGFIFEIVDMDGIRIDKVLVTMQH